RRAGLGRGPGVHVRHRPAGRAARGAGPAVGGRPRALAEREPRLLVDRAANGRGICTEAVGLVVGIALDRLGLHRVQAAVMPRNAASIRVLEKNGFRREGLAPRYLRINGRWEDHLIFAVTAEDPRPSA